MFIFPVENKTMYFFLKYLLLLNEQRNGVSRSFLAQKRIVKLISFFFFQAKLCKVFATLQYCGRRLHQSNHRGYRYCLPLR